MILKNRRKKKIFNKNMEVWIIIVIVLLLIGIIAQCFNPNQSASSGSLKNSNPPKGIRHFESSEMSWGELN